MNEVLRDELVEILRSELPDCSLTGTFAAAMELTEEDRATLTAWLVRCQSAGLNLTPESIRQASAESLRAMFGDARRSDR